MKSAVIKLISAISFALIAIAPAHAVTLLRDADIERGLRELARPVLQAAGLSPGQMRILVVQDSSLNAFVIDRNSIYIHSGLLMRLKTPEQLQGVIAHEAAHIANGHITRRITNFQNAKRNAAYGMILAAAVAAAGKGDAAHGIAFGTQGAAMRAFLAHSRSEEASADRSAISYLHRGKISATGLAQVFEIFAGQEALSAGRQDPYVRSHPMSRDRVRALKSGANRDFETSASAQYWFNRVHGKLTAFIRAPRWTERRINGQTDIDIMRRAVAKFKSSKGAEAAKLMQTVITNRPKDPYYRELLGQIQLESRQFKAAIATYASAAKLAPNEALIWAGYGRALLTQKTKSTDRRALDVLVKSYSMDKRNGRMLRDLAVVYARMGQPAMASLVTAERYLLHGNAKNAKVQAQRALRGLAVGSTAHRRAQDILDDLGE